MKRRTESGEGAESQEEAGGGGTKPSIAEWLLSVSSACRCAVGLWAEALPAPLPREAAEPTSRGRTRHVGAYRTRGRAEECHGWVSVDCVSPPCLMLLASELVPSPPRCVSPAFDCVCTAVASLP